MTLHSESTGLKMNCKNWGSKIRMTKIAFCGLAGIGSFMASNLARHGYSVTGWNPTLDLAIVREAAAAEVDVVSSLAEAVQDADYIFVRVNDVNVEDFLLQDGGIADYAKPNALIIECSLGTYAISELAQKVQARNLRLIKAEIAEDYIAADRGDLIMTVKGNPTWFEECQFLFNVISKTVNYCQDLTSC